MKIFLEKAIFINKAPFEKLELNFSENEISILNWVNWKWKTTIISHIVDSFYEFARETFPNEFEWKENKFYRVSSALHNLDKNKPSFVYLRFKISNNWGFEKLDYLDIRNNCTEEEYNNTITFDDKIPFSSFSETLSKQKYIKIHSNNINNEKIEEIFRTNILTYFPAYRYEQPWYLNDSYKIKLNFKKESWFSWYLPNPIEVTTWLQNLANWVMDVVLDLRFENWETFTDKVKNNVLFWNLNLLISDILISKEYWNVRFWVWERNLWWSRIWIYKDLENKTTIQIYPTIFNMSSWELSLLCLFWEILKQADNNKTNITLDNICWIVLIDEVDKHLHIKLQKEILPKLLKLFKNVQFILSSHSPFLNMWLAEDEELKNKTKIKDISNWIDISPYDDEQYEDVYKMMINENDRFKENFEKLKNEIQSSTKPLIITEWPTDIKHIKKAKEKLNINDIDFDYFYIEWDNKLKLHIQNLAKYNQPRKIIAIFDRDNQENINEIEKDWETYKNYWNNVYAFCIPLVNNDIYWEFTSIEHYYLEKDLKKVDWNWRRLFLWSEFYDSWNSIYWDFQTKISQIQNKVKKNWVIDEKVYKKDDLQQNNSVALSKNTFAELIETDEEFSKDIDFTNFWEIFNNIKIILELN